MSEETKEAAADTAAKKPSLIKTLMLPLIVGVVCAGIGFSIPLAFPSLLGHEQEHKEAPPPEPEFLPFGDIVVNLNEGRMNRYLRIKIALQVLDDPHNDIDVAALIETKKPVLTSWLLGYLADMSMEDIRGATGQNRLRREILDQFNVTLFPEGEDELQDVLFEEFNVQ